MDYERWTPVIFLLFGAATFANGLLSFHNSGTTIETILLIVGGGLMVVSAAPALFRSNWWSLSESMGRPMFFAGLLGLVLYLAGSVLSVIG
jgi:hypothetical protein